MTAGGLIFRLETARFEYNYYKEGGKTTNLRVKSLMVYLISVAECIHSSLVKIISFSLLIKIQTNKKLWWWGIECWNGCLMNKTKTSKEKSSQAPIKITGLKQY